jgi:hypothetical protein
MRKSRTLSIRNKRAAASSQDWQALPVMVSKRLIDLACENFFRSRGMLSKDPLNRWTRSNQTEQPQGDGENRLS